MQGSSEVKVHPLFPTLKEAQQNPALFYSDHLPIITHLPIDQNTEVSLLSYNVTGAGAANNIVRTSEDKSDAVARYERIAHGLKEFDDNYKLDVIVLQEVTVELMVPALKAAFNDNWEILPDEAAIKKQAPQQLTLFRKENLSLDTIQDWHPINKTLSTAFKLNNGKFLVVHNVWTEYDNLPFKTEEYYEVLLKEITPNVCIVVLGDTNSRIAPVFNDDPKNLTTGIIPYPFNSNYGVSEEIQIADHPDGGFYRDSSGKIRQLETQTVNLATGRIDSDRRILTEILGHTPDAKTAGVWSQLRAILCLDHHYQKEKLIRDKTIFEYEQYLKQAFNDPKIRVRVASTIYNHKGFVIRFKNTPAKSTEPKIPELLNKILEGKNIQFTKVTSQAVNYPCFYIEKDQINVFECAANSLALLTKDNVLNALVDLDMLDITVKFLSDCYLLTFSDWNTKAKECLTKAARDYSSGFAPKGIGSSTGTFIKGLVTELATLGLFYDKRAETIVARIKVAEINSQSKIDVILKLLNDDSTGSDKQSFKNLLVSYLVNCEAESDEQVKLLIKVCTLVLSHCKISSSYSNSNNPDAAEIDSDAHHSYTNS